MALNRKAQAFNVGILTAISLIEMRVEDLEKFGTDNVDVFEEFKLLLRQLEGVKIN